MGPLGQLPALTSHLGPQGVAPSSGKAGAPVTSHCREFLVGGQKAGPGFELAGASQF